MYRVVNHQPIPKKMPPKEYRPRKYPFLSMRIGDSFYVPKSLVKPISVRVAASGANTRFAKEANPRRFRCSEDEFGVRVWRIR